MREVISIDKNYVNNTTKEYKSLKPNGNLKGRVTVSLMDKDNIVREVYTENAIMDITKYCQYMRFSQIGSGNSNHINSRWNLVGLTDTLNLYRLSDNYEVNPKKCIIDFWDYKVIGTCGKKELYSGSDTTKGTYNSAESKTYIDNDGNVVYHYVYDFPTHSANGTINAIGFAPSNTIGLYGVIGENVGTDLLLSTDKTGRVSNLFDYMRVCIYGINTTKTGFVLNKHTKFENKLETIKEVTTKDIKGYQIYRFNTKNQNIVGILFTDKQNMLIQKFDLKGELISEENIPMITLNGGTTFIKAILDDNEEYLYVYDFDTVKVYDVKNNYNKIMEYNVLDEGETIRSGSTYACYSTIHVDDKYIMLTYMNAAGDRKRKYYNKQDFSLISSAFRTDSSLYYSIPVTYNNNTTLMANNYGYCYAAGHVVSTLTKLPNEIKKSNIHTMKVQYDIVYTPANIEDFI